MKLRTTVQLSSAITSTIQKKAPLKREDSFLKRFSTRQQVPEAQETFEIGEDDGSGCGGNAQNKYRRKKKRSLPRSVVNPDGNFYFYWLFLLTVCVLYNLWTLIVRESFPELQSQFHVFWIVSDAFTDLVILLDLAVQFRTGYLEQGLMVYKTKKLAQHYIGSKNFWFDLTALLPTDLLQFYLGIHPMLRVPRFLKTYRMYSYYYMVESRTVYPNVWRVVNLIHVLLLLAHWFGCFYYLLSEAENFAGQWVYPNPSLDPSYAPLTRKYLASLYWSTLTLTTIGDLPTPYSNWQYLFTIVSYLIGVFIFATIVGQVGNVITNRNANRLEFERLLDGAKMYMRHHRVPRDMQRRVLRWYDYSWSRGRIQGGGDINTALGLLPDKLKTELALHVNLSVLKKVTIFQECQPEFLHDLVLKMKAYIFTPGDLICRKGEVAREMFIIADGILEVISETGRVLTTMQAGDFFGEIGILNLDGLNKRTADVRSVGYSELFSLSREDVLAAMKDYPEAQEILQTLGRKRLMEARKANAPFIKKPPEKKSPLHLLGHSLARAPDEPAAATDSTGKKIVEKLRSDVKGLRNAIRRSRKSNSSKEDSSEPESCSTKEVGGGRRKESTVSVQQYYGGGRMSIVGSMLPSSSASRGVLKRMHNIVLSDEKEKVGIGGDTSMSNLSPTILPKRVQVQLPTHESFSSPRPPPLAPAESKGVIGAGLPLIQRLRLLRQKEELESQRLAAEAAEVSPAKEEEPTFQTRVSIEPPPKPLWRKGRRASAEPPPTPPAHPPLTPDSRRTSNESSASEPAAMGASLCEGPEEWPERELRPSALRFQRRDNKTYGSVDDLSPEFSRLPFIKKLKILNERQKIAELLTNKTSHPVLLTRSTSEGSSEIPQSLPPEAALHSVPHGRRTQSSSEEYRKRAGGGGSRVEPPPFPLPLPSPSSSSSSEAEGPVCLSGPAPSPPLSPESNETPERRHLKSILKTLSKSAEGAEEEGEGAGVQEEPTPDLDEASLLRAHTVEGYAARHRKFAKNVTFQRQAVTVVSPEGGTGEGPGPEGLAGVSPPSRLTDIEGSLDPAALSVPPENLKMPPGPELPVFQMKGGTPFEAPPALSNIGLSLGLAVAQEECIGGVFLGIKNIIQSKMDEMQLKFQDSFLGLQTEVCRLQTRLSQLEALSAAPSRLLNHHQAGYEEDDEEEEEDPDLHRAYPPPSSYLFSRGDSIDTVIGKGDEAADYDDDDEVFEEADHMHAGGAGLAQPASWTAAERESIEMTDFTQPPIPLWQLEFHRDGPPPTDSVTVEIGNTSTEYESSSSSSDEGSRVLQEVPVPLGDSDDEVPGSGDSCTEEEEEEELDNTNWEVQMLAKEMERNEERRAGEGLHDLLDLEGEIQEMRDVVSSGALSPTELDMLESVLESRTRRVRALSKAYSTEEGPRGGVVSRPRGASLQYPLSLANLHANMGMALGGRRSEFLPRKRSNVQRQTSLSEPRPMEPGGRRRESAGSLGKSFKSSSSAAEQAPKSFFSRFSLLRTLSRTFLHGEAGGPEPGVSYTPAPATAPTVPVPIGLPPSGNLSRKTSSSAGVLPLVTSSLSSVLSSSVKSDPGAGSITTKAGGPEPSRSAPTSIFTIPAPDPDPAARMAGESQPLLKK